MDTLKSIRGSGTVMVVIQAWETKSGVQRRVDEGYVTEGSCGTTEFQMEFSGRS